MSSWGNDGGYGAPQRSGYVPPHLRQAGGACAGPGPGWLPCPAAAGAGSHAWAHGWPDGACRGAGSANPPPPPPSGEESMPPWCRMIISGGRGPGSFRLAPPWAAGSASGGGRGRVAGAGRGGEAAGRQQRAPRPCALQARSKCAPAPRSQTKTPAAPAETGQAAAAALTGATAAAAAALAAATAGMAAAATEEAMATGALCAGLHCTLGCALLVSPLCALQAAPMAQPRLCPIWAWRRLGPKGVHVHPRKLAPGWARWEGRGNKCVPSPSWSC